MPPGNVMNASARSSMICLRSRMVSVTISSSASMVGDFATHQHLGDDADGPAAAGPRGGGQRAHRGDVAAAPDQSPAPFGDRLAEFGGQRQQLRVSGPGRAVHADRPRVRHIAFGVHSRTVVDRSRPPCRRVAFGPNRISLRVRAIKSGGAECLGCRAAGRRAARGRGRLGRSVAGVVLIGADGVGKTLAARRAAEDFAADGRCAGWSAPPRNAPSRSARSARCWRTPTSPTTAGRPICCAPHTTI